MYNLIKGKNNISLLNVKFEEQMQVSRHLPNKITMTLSIGCFIHYIGLTNSNASWHLKSQIILCTKVTFSSAVKMQKDIIIYGRLILFRAWCTFMTVTSSTTETWNRATVWLTPDGCSSCQISDSGISKVKIAQFKTSNCGYLTENKCSVKVADVWTWAFWFFND